MTERPSEERLSATVSLTNTVELSQEVLMPRDHKLRFQIVASDGRCSDVWRVWSVRNDVYVAPRSKVGEFKISLHQSGK